MILHMHEASGFLDLLFEGAARCNTFAFAGIGGARGREIACCEVVGALPASALTMTSVVALALELVAAVALRSARGSRPWIVGWGSMYAPRSGS